MTDEEEAELDIQLEDVGPKHSFPDNQAGPFMHHTHMGLFSPVWCKA